MIAALLLTSTALALACLKDPIPQPTRWVYLIVAVQDAEGTHSRITAKPLVAWDIQPQSGTLRTKGAWFRSEPPRFDINSVLLNDPAPEGRSFTFEIDQSWGSEHLIRRGTLQKRYRVVEGKLFDSETLKLRLEDFQPIHSDETLTRKPMAYARAERRATLILRSLRFESR